MLEKTDPLLMAECFIKDFKRGCWDEFGDSHVLGVCDMIMRKVDENEDNEGERVMRKSKVWQDISCIQWSCWSAMESEKNFEN